MECKFHQLSKKFSWNSHTSLIHLWLLSLFSGRVASTKEPVWPTQPQTFRISPSQNKVCHSATKRWRNADSGPLPTTCPLALSLFCFSGILRNPGRMDKERKMTWNSPHYDLCLLKWGFSCVTDKRKYPSLDDWGNRESTLEAPKEQLVSSCTQSGGRMWLFLIIFNPCPWGRQERSLAHQALLSAVSILTLVIHPPQGCGWS